MAPPPVTKKRRASACSAQATAPTPTKHSSSVWSKRPPSAAALAAAASAKRLADSVQVSLPFAQREPIGLKILLPDTIYPNAASVRSFLLPNFFFYIIPYF
jgi:hypothetical protein